MKKFVLLVLVLSLCAGCLRPEPIACTADAKICPDGSAVGRVPPDCEFAPCPANCSSYTVETCPNQCVVCPPCEVCSSISCQTEELCESIGFHRDWYRKVAVSGTAIT
ncbi:MAG: hypothetical protein LUO93_11495 [Methanomicrobiales archaeon]|nr:hypothetical protein [Methanomicrobiales archaeon]